MREGETQWSNIRFLTGSSETEGKRGKSMATKQRREQEKLHLTAASPLQGLKRCCLVMNNFISACLSPNSTNSKTKGRWFIFVTVITSQTTNELTQLTSGVLCSQSLTKLILLYQRGLLFKNTTHTPSHTVALGDSLFVAINLFSVVYFK